MKNWALAVSISVLTGCFEYRVLLRSFAHSIALVEPYNYIVITIGLYTIVALLSAYCLGFFT